MLEHLTLSSSEVKNEWSCTSASHICLNDVEGERERETFITH
jgi:hypothetical protein